MSKENKYKLTLSVNGEKIKSEGKTILQALTGLEVKKFNTKAFLSVSYGSKEVKNYFLKMHDLKRLFSKSIYKEILAKRLNELL